MMFLSFLVHKQAANMASALGIHPEYANVYLLTGRVSTRIEHIFLIMPRWTWRSGIGFIPCRRALKSLYTPLPVTARLQFIPIDWPSKADLEQGLIMK
jgi:hypothetical protein